LNTLQSAFLLNLIEDKLSSLIRPDSLLQEAARYSLLSAGKRLRPLLTLVASQAFGAPLEAALTPACALELIHTYSLIHDDLPCMDNDDFRRNKPSLHKAYSEGVAILTGDYLLTFAFEILSDSPHLTDPQKIQLIRFLSARAGDKGMIGGQMLDILSEKQSTNWERLKNMHLGKTAALITVALEFGGIIAKVTPKAMELLHSIGNHLGLAFQIIDDLLDGDTENEKSTNILSLMDKKEAEAKADELFTLSTQLLAHLPYPIQDLQLLAEQLVYRKQ